MALCAPLLLVRVREQRQRSNRSEREGAPDEQPSGLTAKTPPGSESPRRKTNTASRVATRQVRLMILVVSVHQRERAKLFSTRTLHGPIVPRISQAHECTRSLQPFDDCVGNCWCALLDHGQMRRPMTTNSSRGHTFGLISNQALHAHRETGHLSSVRQLLL